MPPGHERNVIYTYRYLRVAMISLLLMLIFSVVYQVLTGTGGTCWLGSISAYYFTPARTVFVGSLCALGVCLIAYQGHTREEDVLLNFSGFMAFVVAIVPTAPDGLCGPNAYVQTASEIASAVRNNIMSLVVAAALAPVIVRLLRPRSKVPEAPARRTRRSIAVSILCLAVVVIESVLFFVVPARFIAVSHLLAAVTMVLGIIGVMVLSAFREEVQESAGRSGKEVLAPAVEGPEPRFKNTYVVIAGLLLLALAGALLAAAVTSFDHLILWAELTVVLLFSLYWGVQTRELWHLHEEITTVAVAAISDQRGSAAAETKDHDLGSSAAPGSAPGPDVAEGRAADTVAS